MAGEKAPRAFPIEELPGHLIGEVLTSGGLAAADLARLEATCRALRPLAEYAAPKLCAVRAAFVSLKRDSGHVTTKNVSGVMKKLRGLNEVVSEEEIVACRSRTLIAITRLNSNPSSGYIHLGVSLIVMSTGMDCYPQLF
jgi:hypothetical protein